MFRCSFAERNLAREAGFHWDKTEQRWYTRELMAASKLREYADSAAEEFLSRHTFQVSPWPYGLPSAPAGLELYPHQHKALAFSLSRKRVYLALKPGLGKTPLAAMVARAVATASATELNPIRPRVVYIAPPFLLRNVMNEFERWGAGDLIYLFPDSIIQREDTIDMITRIATKGFATSIVVDEAHRFKNPDAKRTVALLGKGKKPGLVDLFDRHIYMSGTPMPNRPIELFPILQKSAHDLIDFMNYYQFGIRYCAGFKSDWAGWDFSGASNMEELAQRIQPFMLSMGKELLDLPPKLQEVFVMSTDLSPRLAAMDHDIGSQYADTEDLIKTELAKSIGKSSGDGLHLMTYRRLLGVEKVKTAAEYIRSILDETDEAVIVSAFHKEVIAGLTEALNDWAPLVIDGSTSAETRQARVDEFQNNPKRRLVIGNYVAMGIGFNMTKASRVLHVEYSWVPGDNDQTSDRAHRIGQTKTVLEQFMVYKDSLDKRVIEALLKKRKATQHF